MLVSGVGFQGWTQLRPLARVPCKKKKRSRYLSCSYTNTLPSLLYFTMTKAVWRQTDLVLDHGEGFGTPREQIWEGGWRSPQCHVRRTRTPLFMLPWSPLQCTLGGFEELQSMKAEKREVLGLPPLPEDSIKVIRNMRAASPPASASDLIEQQQKRGRREHKVSPELGPAVLIRRKLGSGHRSWSSLCPGYFPA